MHNVIFNKFFSKMFITIQKKIKCFGHFSTISKTRPIKKMFPIVTLVHSIHFKFSSNIVSILLPPSFPVRCEIVPNSFLKLLQFRRPISIETQFQPHVASLNNYAFTTILKIIKHPQSQETPASKFNIWVVSHPKDHKFTIMVN